MRFFMHAPDYEIRGRNLPHDPGTRMFKNRCDRASLHVLVLVHTFDQVIWHHKKP